MQKQLTISTILSIPILQLCTASVRNPLPTSCAPQRLRRKRVSIHLVCHCFFFSSFLFFFYLFFIFLNKFFPFEGMTTKFNQGMYSKMRAKKNEPLSNLDARTVRVVEKGVSVTPTTLDIETTKTASLATSTEEITLLRKKQRVADKGKNKADSRSSSVWDDVGLALARAQEAFTTEELRVFSGMSPNKVVGRHLHKLVQVVYLYKFILFFFIFFALF